MYKALFATAYYRLFRIGELTQSEHSLKACNVYIGDNKNKFRFVLYSSKTHSLGNYPQIIKISSVEQKSKDPLDMTQEYLATVCPFKLMKEYLEMQGDTYDSEDEQFFIFRNKIPVQAEHVRTILKKALQLRGLNPKLYGTHSCRSSRSVDLLGMGVPVEIIKKLGRWKSSAVYRYLK